VFSHGVIVFCSNSYRFFSVVTSLLHSLWVDEFSSTLKTDPRYTVADAFETFPFPVPSINSFLLPADQNSRDRLSEVGKRFTELREYSMVLRNEGLTSVYNRMHDPSNRHHDIVALREGWAELNHVVFSEYRYLDLDCSFDFFKTAKGLRYTISEPARREVLQRLLKLNHERYAEEVKQGLHEKKAAKKSAPKATTKKSAKKDTETPKPSTPMLDFGDDESE
jgi:hypothetical protein